MFIFFMVSVVVLFILQIAIGMAWYSFIFAKPFNKYGEFDSKNSDQKALKTSMQMQMLLTFLEAMLVTICVAIIPWQHSMLAIAGYHLVLLWIVPITMFKDNLWLKGRHTVIVLINATNKMVTLSVLFFTAFFIKSFF